MVDLQIIQPCLINFTTDQSRYLLSLQLLLSSTICILLNLSGYLIHEYLRDIHAKFAGSTVESKQVAVTPMTLGGTQPERHLMGDSILQQPNVSSAIYSAFWLHGVHPGLRVIGDWVNRLGATKSKQPASSNKHIVLLV